MEEQIHAVEYYWQLMLEMVVVYGPKLIGAIIVLIVGLWLVKVITRLVDKGLNVKNIDQSLVPFLVSLTNTLLKVLVFISVLGMIGIEMTSFIALLGAAGLAVGMALSGTLQNFAGGVIILIIKPFKVGDFIEAQGYMGTVKAISIFNTHLNTPDKKLVIIPNGSLSTGSLTNFSAEPIRRVDWKFGIAYGDDMENFKQAINDFIAEDDRIKQDPVPFIALTELGDSSVNFAVRVWVEAADYWSVYFAMNEKVYKRFSDYQLNIPFPQMDVHVKK
jgi:small conductance mechanosensitive channel